VGAQTVPNLRRVRVGGGEESEAPGLAVKTVLTRQTSPVSHRILPPALPVSLIWPNMTLYRGDIGCWGTWPCAGSTASGGRIDAIGTLSDRSERASSQS